MYDFSKSCDDCQKTHTLEKYHTTVDLPLIILSLVYSIYFAGLFHIPIGGFMQLLFYVYHFTWWPIIKATKYSTADTAIGLILYEFMYSFGALKIVFSDKYSSFTSKCVGYFI